MRLYNTLSRQVEGLPAPEAGPVRMYFCGPTVYQRAHIGNARPFLLSMWLRDWLRHRGYDAKLVHNITDVNDKIYDAAPGASAELAARATQWYLEDIAGFGLGLPDALPKATEHIQGIVRFIEELIARGNAYAVEGDVYFRVASDPGYGRLSGQRPDQMVDEEENPNPLKQDPRDFALWKANKPGEDTAWESPWGRGRPGWHIECSVMAEEELGTEFELHGGGLDLVFPHHENELAQSTALGHRFARIWTHNGMLEFGGEKMSKSLGNDVSIRNVLDTWGREVALLYFMTAHWRKPIDFTDTTLEQAKAQWQSFGQAIYEAKPARPSVGWEAFEAALDDDFNTPGALAVLHEWRRASQLELLNRGLSIFGLGFVPEQPPDEVGALVEERETARLAKDWQRSDELRDRIAELGWIVQDGPAGSQLVPK
jgi:cysteinyl-tRNA synthetase